MVADDFFEVFDVSSRDFLELEPMGSKENKRWFALAKEERVLFKPVTYNKYDQGLQRKGDDWAEKLASEFAAVLDIPSARVDLARYHGDPGIISWSVAAEGERLELGNEILYAHDHGYVRDKTHRQEQYTLQRNLRRS